ncbi:hypothetical protein [Gordonia sp. NB41Y]|uniref:hypothetical protein n=1 Tax=Gordonia sp. NB41Y TaxID=875808 RepID=UPI00273B61CF|nr:hypothetical protein [Gordonia sp. NB41Y]WLP92923.1 hypothetical protein Q9K23_12215 [Gordonia sp. NB41Y]
MFPEQVSGTSMSIAGFYAICVAAVIIVVAGITLVDVGLVSRKNRLDTAVQKLIGTFIAVAAYAVVGNAIWNWQFNQATGTGSFGDLFTDWSLWGSFSTTPASETDPAVFADADVHQVFLAFNAIFMGAAVAVLHSLGLQRLKAKAYFIIAAVVGGLVGPLNIYLTWGSASPLTARGYHDFLGVAPLYIFAAFFGLVLVWRLGPAQKADLELNALGLSIVGLLMMMFGCAVYALGCGIIIPDVGFLGISYSTSGLGVVSINIMMAFAFGAVGGLVVGYLTRNIIVTALSPLCGFVSCAPGMDILEAWQVAIIAFFAPMLTALALRFVTRIGLDEKKIIGLGIGSGVYGVLATGVFAWGTPTGGVSGVESGTYAFQGAEVNLGWQLLGVVAMAASGAVAALILTTVLKHTVGLRVSDEAMDRGLDEYYWGGGDSAGSLPETQTEDMVVVQPATSSTGHA